MRRFGRAWVGLVAGTALLPGCAGGAEPSAPVAEEDKPTVVTAFYPLQFVAERVAGDRAEVTTLTQPGAEPHDLELTPQQVASLSEADLVIYSKGFQPAVDEAIAQSGAKNVLETTTVVPLAPVAPAHSDNEDATVEDPEEEHAKEDEHGEEHAGEDEHGHEEGGLDPHFWLDPTTMVDLSAAVSEKLSALDAEDATAHAENRKRLVTDLADLDADWTAGLQNCELKEFVTTHDAFSYLARRYRLTQIPIGGLSPNAEPSPDRIAEVQVEVMEHGITTIFYETLVSPAVAKSLAGDLQVKIDVLDPVEGITAQSKGADYLEVMRANLAALQRANACR